MLPDRFPDTLSIRKRISEYDEIDLSSDNILTHHLERIWSLYMNHTDDNKLIARSGKQPMTLFDSFSGDLDGELDIMLRRNTISAMEFYNHCHCCGISFDIAPHIGELCDRCYDSLSFNKFDDDSNLILDQKEEHHDLIEEMIDMNIILP